MDTREQAHEEIDIRYKRKVIRSRRIWIFLIVINFALVIYAGVCILISFKNFVVDQLDPDSNKIIKLCSKSTSGSRKVYKEWQFDDTTVVNDYSFYGEYLWLSNYYINPRPEIEDGQFHLVNACQKNETATYPIDITKNDAGINLRNLDSGDYLIFLIGLDGSYKNLVSDNAFDEKIYLLPQDGKRFSARIRSLKTNPNLVLSITREKPPANYFDLVFDHSDKRYFDSVINNLDKSLLIKEIRDKEPLKDERMKKVLSSNPRYSLIITDNSNITGIDVITSSYLNAGFEFDNPLFKNKKQLMNSEEVDDNFFIRESGGKLTGALACRKEIEGSCLLTDYANQSRQGILSIVIDFEQEIYLRLAPDWENILESFNSQFSSSLSKIIKGEK